MSPSSGTLRSIVVVSVRERPAMTIVSPSGTVMVVFTERLEMVGA